MPLQWQHAPHASKHIAEAVEGLISASPIATIMANLMVSTNATVSPHRFVQNRQQFRLQHLTVLMVEGALMLAVLTTRITKQTENRFCATHFNIRCLLGVSDCRLKQLGDLGTSDGPW